MLTLDTELVRAFWGEGVLDVEVAAGADVLARCAVGAGAPKDAIGWLDVDKWAGKKELERVEELATRVRERADTLVLIGVGGSNNASRAVAEALRPAGCRVVYAGNTLSAAELNRVMDELSGHDVVLDCVAKNFETLEPGVTFRLLRQWLESQVGTAEAARRIVCTGTPESHLETLCREHGWAFNPFPADVGGRFTALTPVHLLPLAAAGVDVRALAEGARAEMSALRAASAGENCALCYAAVRHLAYERGCAVELFASFEPRLRWLGLWWQQLFAESEGKEGRGLLPVVASYSEELHSLGQFVQDGSHVMFETFLDVATPCDGDSCSVGDSSVEDGFGYLDGRDLWDVNHAALAATQRAHAEVLPVVTLGMERLDAEHYGRLFAFFEFSCYISATLLGVNPFDQPGVEAYKHRMFAALGKDAC